MNEAEILKSIKKIYNEEVWSSCAETEEGFESWIEGEDVFFERLEKMLLPILKPTYTRIKTDKQYYEYCDLLEEIDFSDEAGDREDEMNILTLLIEQWDEKQTKEKLGEL